MTLFYKISIDRINDNYISGWCFHRLRKSEAVQLGLFSSKECLGEMKADQFREDLRALDVHPSGRCGFELVTSRKIVPGDDKLKLIDLATGSTLLTIDAGGFKIKKGGILGSLSSLNLPSIGKKKGCILFMHIPKTAGTTFNTQIRSVLSDFPLISHIESYDKDQLSGLKNKYRYISGHLRYGYFNQYFCGPGAQLYTIVREPYAHLHSHLKWVMKSASDRDDNTLKYRNRTIYDLGCRIKDLDFKDIDALKQFACDIQGVEAAFFDNMQTRHFLAHRVDRVQDEHLEEAIANSQDFQLIGLTERYSEFVENFSKMNEIKIEVEIGPLNKALSDPLFDIKDSGTREALLPLVRYDLELYDYISKNRA